MMRERPPGTPDVPSPEPLRVTGGMHRDPLVGGGELVFDKNGNSTIIETVDIRMFSLGVQAEYPASTALVPMKLKSFRSVTLLTSRTTFKLAFPNTPGRQLISTQSEQLRGEKVFIGAPELMFLDGEEQLMVPFRIGSAIEYFKKEGLWFIELVV